MRPKSSSRGWPNTQAISARHRSSTLSVSSRTTAKLTFSAISTRLTVTGKDLPRPSVSKKYRLRTGRWPSALSKRRPSSRRPEKWSPLGLARQRLNLPSGTTSQAATDSQTPVHKGAHSLQRKAPRGDPSSGVRTAAPRSTPKDGQVNVTQSHVCTKLQVNEERRLLYGDPASGPQPRRCSPSHVWNSH